MDAQERDVGYATRPSSVALWTGALAGPIAFVCALEARFALVQYVCMNHAPWIPWAITIVALLVTAFGALCSWKGWVDDTPRVRFMAFGGLCIGAMFALALIAMAIPDLFLRACE
jgi:hypothetical protein